MSILAQSLLTTTANSFETGRNAAREIRERGGPPPRLVLTYLTLTHDPSAYLAGLTEVFGREVPIVGCSAQGVVGRQRSSGLGVTWVGHTAYLPVSAVTPSRRRPPIDTATL